VAATVAPADRPFALADSLPDLARLTAPDPALVTRLTAYARQVLRRENLQQEADLERLFDERAQLIPLLTRIIPEDVEGTHPKVAAELERIGIGLTMAEGIVTGVAPAPVLTDLTEAWGGPAFKAYLTFIYAHAQTLSGEYPYLNMEPYKDMILTGEVLQSYKDEPYFDKISDQFYEALDAFTDIHFVQEGDENTRSLPTLLVGGASLDPYPGSTTLDERKALAKSRSRYSKVIANILRNPSAMVRDGDHLYLIVVDWRPSQREARKAVHQYLDRGLDVPHYLSVKRGDGTEQFAIVYRFFDSEPQANTALETALLTLPDARLCYISREGGEMYELGPGE
jgi:hypothetical protein